jgi:hypothetical protein
MSGGSSGAYATLSVEE